MMFDFANSGYTTVVITAVFNAYFVAVVANKEVWATFAWTLALSVSYALIVVSAPLIGAYADAHAAKKNLLAITTIGCVAATAALALVGPGELALGIALLVVSNFFFGTGENLIAAFLPELAKGSTLGRVSGWGWALGYIGGLVSLGASLAYVPGHRGTGNLPRNTCRSPCASPRCCSRCPRCRLSSFCASARHRRNSPAAFTPVRLPERGKPCATRAAIATSCAFSPASCSTRAGCRR
jgi:hypothetical protein